MPNLMTKNFQIMISYSWQLQAYHILSSDSEARASSYLARFCPLSVSKQLERQSRVHFVQRTPGLVKQSQGIRRYDWVVWWGYHLDRIYGLSFRALRVRNNKKDGFIKLFWFIFKYITHFTVYKHGSTGS